MADYNYRNPNENPYKQQGYSQNPYRQQTPPPYGQPQGYQQNPYGKQPQAAYGQALTPDETAAKAMKLVYLKMCVALVVTGLVSYFCGNSSEYTHFFATNRWFMWVLIIAQFGIVLGIGAGLNKLSSTMGTVLFYVYSVIMGLWIAPIFVVYTHASIAKTFFITAGTFGAMSIYGYTTKQDLTKFGKILMMALFGLIIAMIVNIFTKSSQLDWIISIVGVLIFVGLTAWDTQKIKQLAQVIPASEHGRLATLGALNLYLDFINIFLFLLRFFGRRD